MSRFTRPRQRKKPDKKDCKEKHYFHSYREANKYANNVVMAKFRSNTAVYKCPKCRGFHLRKERW